MNKTLMEKLKEFEVIFKDGGWNLQIEILLSIGNNNTEIKDNPDIEQILEDLSFQLSDFYLKNDMDTLHDILEENLNESILVNAFKKHLDTKWGLREHSIKVLTLDHNELNFIIEEIIKTMIVKRIHRSPNIIRKTINNEFNKEYDKETIWDIVTIFDYLIEFFNDNNHTYNSFRQVLNKETLFSPEIISMFFNLLQKYQTDIEKAYILKKITDLDIE